MHRDTGLSLCVALLVPQLTDDPPGPIGRTTSSFLSCTPHTRPVTRELIMLRLEDQVLETLLRKALDGVVKKRILAILLSFFLGLVIH